MLTRLLNNVFAVLLGWLFKAKQQKEDENELLKDFQEIDSYTEHLSRKSVLNKLRKR